jgi:hypothetical protein
MTRLGGFARRPEKCENGGLSVSTLGKPRQFCARFSGRQAKLLVVSSTFRRTYHINPSLIPLAAATNYQKLF